MRFGPVELLLIAGILVFLFGASKLPTLAESAGKSLRIFKKEIHSEDKEESDS